MTTAHDNFVVVEDGGVSLHTTTTEELFLYFLGESLITGRSLSMWRRGRRLFAGLLAAWAERSDWNYFWEGACPGFHIQGICLGKRSREIWVYFRAYSRNQEN